MAEHLYEVAWTYTSGAAAHAVGEIIPAALAAGKRPAELREIGLYNVSGAAAELGFGRPAAIGVTPGTLVTVQAGNSMDTIAGNTQVAASWGTAPTAPGTFMRRAPIQTVVGGGAIWVWNAGELVLWSGAAISTFVIWQLSVIAVTYDFYAKFAE